MFEMAPSIACAQALYGTLITARTVFFMLVYPFSVSVVAENITFFMRILLITRVPFVCPYEKS